MENRLRTDDFPRLVLDANVMVSAAIGGSFPLLVRLFIAGVDLLAPVHQWAETRHVLLNKIKAPPDWVRDQMTELATVIRPIHPAVLEPYRERSLSRLRPGAQPDWPVLAATYAARAAVWSHDKDLWGTGAPIWFTRTLRREMELHDAAEK